MQNNHAIDLAALQAITRNLARTVAPIAPEIDSAHASALAGNANGAVGSLVVVRQSLVDALALLDAAVLIHKAPSADPVASS